MQVSQSLIIRTYRMYSNYDYTHSNKYYNKIMWLIYALISSFFAGITSVLAKCGINKTDSTIATALRTIAVCIFSWSLVTNITYIETKTLVFLILSGLSTGASWLCYFKALQLGDINKVVPIDKSSIVLTIILASMFLNEGISLLKFISIILIGLGTLFMIDKKDSSNNSNNKQWLIYACLSALFASLTSIFGKIGITNINSNYGNAIRTTVVLIMSWAMVFITNKSSKIKTVDKKEIIFIVLSGIATGVSWLAYYKALQVGPLSIIAPIDKLSILVTIIFSYFVFKEKLSFKALVGLLLIIIGTLLLVLRA